MDYLFTYGVVPTTEAPSLPVKQTDFGAMPSHWQEISIGELFHVQLGKMLSPKSQIGLSPLPYLRNANVQWGRCNLANLKAMDFDLREREKFRLLPGDLLICEGGDVGRTAMWRGELRECYFQKAIHRLRPKSDNISPTYFMYWMMELFLFRRYPFSDGTKTTIPHLPAVKLKAMCLPLPPKSEQDEIARILTAVDRKLDAEQQRLKALRGIFDSALHHLMTGKIRIPESLEV
jgi:type I restriction enzyme S subunit